MSPDDDLRRRSSEEDSIEQKRVITKRDPGAGEGWGFAAERRGGVDARQLPASEAVVGQVWARWRGGAETRQRGEALAPGAAGQRAPEDPATGAQEVRRLRAHAGRRASGERRSTTHPCRNVAALDAGRRPVAAGVQSATASQPARAQSALRRVGADGRQLSRLVSEARRHGVPEEPGGPCDLDRGSCAGRSGNHRGSGARAPAVDREVGVPLARYTDWKNVYVRDPPKRNNCTEKCP